MVNFLFAKASCCSMEHRKTTILFFFGKSDFLIFQAHSFWGGGWAGLVSVVAPIAVACTYASITHLRIAPS